MRFRSKRYTACLEAVPKTKLTIPLAVQALRGFKPTKFDSTVNLTFHLGVDPKQADQALRGAISLPNGIGQSKKVIAFCDGDDIVKPRKPAPSRPAPTS